jgi:hypothetical protein
VAPRQAADLLYGLVALSWLFFLYAGFIFTVALPLMAFVLMRNTKKIRLELTRLNEILESRLVIDAPTAPRR